MKTNGIHMDPMLSFRWTTPDGKAFVFITETKPIQITVVIGKSGTSLAALVYALTCMINEMLRFKTLDEVIQMLQDITTSKSVFNTNGVECRSTPEAIAFALIEYKRYKSAHST